MVVYSKTTGVLRKITLNNRYRLNLNFEEKEKTERKKTTKEWGDRKNHNMLIGIENIAAELKAIM